MNRKSKVEKVGRRAKRKKTGGRQKGTPNKVSVSVRQAVIDAFVKLGASDAMARWGKRHPGEFYKICSKLIGTP